MPPKVATKGKVRVEDVPLTTAQGLGSIIKSARDMMRKDKGLNGDLDRLPLLTWIMFLKFLDDLELQRLQEAKLANKRFRPAIEAPYRWRDWAAKIDGITGNELLAFINQDETILPDGTKGPGLFAYLRGLTSANGDDRRDVIATVFKGVDNRMKSGYLLRDVINKISGIHFTSSEELHTLGMLYESMLGDMRDAAGDSGEFYTPRAVVRLMVGLIDPQLGETVLDPASGTGGFLVEAFTHLAQQVRTVEERKVLQESSLSGCEPKSLPYLLCQMNLLLHGLDAPRIDPGNALRFKLSEIGEKERVDIVLTNPPFGGEEEKGIQGNFPEDRQTSETALLFLQLIMRRLHRSQTSAGRAARAAVVVPDGLLSQEGVGARIREVLVKDFNLHTIVRLPRSVFAPYTKSSTSILFFDTAKVTDVVWFYQIPVRPDVKEYTQRRPFLFEECAPLFEWWRNRAVCDRAWMVTADQLRAQEYSFGFSNPTSGSTSRFPEPKDLLHSLSGSVDVCVARLKDITELWGEIDSHRREWDLVPAHELLKPIERPVVVKSGVAYRLLAMSWYARGLYIKDTKDGSAIKGRLLYEVQEGDFVYNRLFAWKGSFAEVTADVAGCFVSNEFPCYRLENTRVSPGYLWAYFSQPDLWEAIERTSSGTTSTSRLRLKESKLAAMQIPLPPKPVQIQIAKIAESVRGLRSLLENVTKEAPSVADAILERACRKPL